MTDRSRLTRLVAAMSTACLLSGAVAIFLFYDAVDQWGVTSNIDTSTLRGPLLKALVLGGISAVLAIASSAFMFFRLTSPLLSKLEDEQVKTQSIVETAVDGIITIDQRGTIKTFNRAAERMFGYEFKEVRGKNVSFLMPEPDRSHHDQYIESYMTGGAPQIIGIGREVRGRHKNGECFPMDLAVSEVRNAGVVSFTGIVRDITNRKERQAELELANKNLATAHGQLIAEQTKLIRAEKLSSVGLLAAGVAHEINNPLSGVMACLKAIREGKVREDRREEYFETAKDGLDRIQSIVRGLLDYARERPLSLQTIDPHEVVGSCLRLVAPTIRGKKIEIETTGLKTPYPLYADRSQVMQALMNIIINAVHASPEGGTIRIALQNSREMTGLSVSDQGTGMSEEIAARVKDPFFTTKAEGQGTGLGLSVTDSIAQAHGGSLTIDTAPGQGTSVVLWLPTPEDSTS